MCRNRLQGGHQRKRLCMLRDAEWLLASWNYKRLVYAETITDCTCSRPMRDSVRAETMRGCPLYES